MQKVYLQMLKKVWLFLFLIVSCKQPETNVDARSTTSNISDSLSNAESKKVDNFKSGIVNDAIGVLTNPSQTFALYLPKSYTNSQTYPVVFFFDAHAAGRLPLDKYALLADEFNFILIGSNNSKNGMQPDALMNIANDLISDVQKRFPIDSKRQYLAGFSGGSRVAGMVAMQTPAIAGLIACSAGINLSNQKNLPFAVVAITGKEDFNMTELVTLSKTLAKTAVPHQLLLFDGKHVWCPNSTMKDAFLFLETVAMKNQTASTNNALLNNFKTTTEKEAIKMQAANKLVEAANNYEKLIHYLSGLHDTKKYERSLQSILQSKNYQTELSKNNQLIAQENQMREQYYQSFGKEISWWNNEVTKINDEIQRQGKSDMVFMLKRLLGSLSLASYMQANAAISANELKKAEYILQIYQLVDPTNTEAWYLSAGVHAKLGNTLVSLQELSKAVNLSFKDRDRLINDPMFNSISSTPEFNGVLNNIKP